MNANELYVDGTYLAKNPTWHEEDSPWKASKIIDMLDHHGVRPKSVCEVGCGAGEILNFMSNQYSDEVRFSGYEISPQAYEICRKKEKKNLNFYYSNLVRMPNVSFDVVMAIDVFEHVEDYFGFLRGLKNTGIYKIFHIPLDLSVQTVLRNSPIISQRISVGHLHYFTKDTALATLTDSGYDIIGYRYTNGSLELPSASWKTSILKLPRKLGFLINQDLTVRVLGGFSLLVLAK